MFDQQNPLDQVTVMVGEGASGSSSLYEDNGTTADLTKSSTTKSFTTKSFAPKGKASGRGKRF